MELSQKGFSRNPVTAVVDSINLTNVDLERQSADFAKKGTYRGCLHTKAEKFVATLYPHSNRRSVNRICSTCQLHDDPQQQIYDCHSQTGQYYNKDGSQHQATLFIMRALNLIY